MSQEIDLPEFAKKVLYGQTCQSCSKKLELEDVVALGVRKYGKENTYFYYEIRCGKCQNPRIHVIDTRPCNVYGLGEIISDMNKPNQGEDQSGVFMSLPKPVFAKKSSISDKEVDSFKDMMRTSTTFEEIMKFIGLTQTDIKEEPEQGKPDENQ